MTVHWRGEYLTHHELTRPVARYEQLHDFARLKERITALWKSGCTSTTIAETLNAEGFHMPRGRHQQGEHQHTRKTVRKLIDCLIAATAIRTGVPVLHSDTDFDRLARHTSLRVEIS